MNYFLTISLAVFCLSYLRCMWHSIEQAKIAEFLKDDAKNVVVGWILTADYRGEIRSYSFSNYGDAIIAAKNLKDFFTNPLDLDMDLVPRMMRRESNAG